MLLKARAKTLTLCGQEGHKERYKHMRAIVCSLILGLFPALSLAETVQFTFNGYINADAADGISTFWTGPGPEPTNFQLTFDVNTLSPLNTVSYTFGPTSEGPSIFSITADLVATNLSLSLDGKTVLQNPSGVFGFSGGPLGEFSFIGGGLGAGTPGGAATGAGGPPGVSMLFLPDFGLGTTLQSVLMGSHDPLGLILNGSGFSSDDGDPSVLFLSLDGFASRVGATVGGQGTAVPEPDILALLALAGICLGFVHRRGVPRAASNPSTKAA
jgi:hypothetical protein